MGSSSGSHSTSHHKRYSSPRDSISPYASSYAERRSNQYAQSDSHSRSSVMSDQEGEEPTPRKRIAVAVSGSLSTPRFGYPYKYNMLTTDKTTVPTMP